ncbi:CDP-diacylglycerol--glycerol-3-phosphate 3-phosphatidyltransferase [Coemansia nantahalensis]|nr:CDP-diacylglycerol--glycerol-3-phosphate 3-phosphatidyltransferase [Coemansia nantahalensis]
MHRARLCALRPRAVLRSTRWYSAAAAHPPPAACAGRPGHSTQAARQAFESLMVERPVFPIRQPICVLREPQEFYRELLRGIAQAQRRVCLSSLYLGSQETELVAALDQALARNPALEVHVLLDCLRGTRLDSAGASSATLLAPLVAAHGRDRVRVSLYHTPALSGVSKRAWPQRFNEAFGLQHIKAYVFDDSVIISGANLSRDYFTNRQDRYMRVSDRPFADYFAGLVDAVGRVSFGVAADGRGHRLAMARDVPDPSREPREFVREANAVLTQFLRRMEAVHPAGSVDALGEQVTVAIPTVQMRQLAITQDEHHMSEFFAAADRWAQRRPCRSVMASAYFNFSDHYKRAVLEGHGRWDLLVASPQANGFYAARGISQFIPDMYSIIERDFVREAGRRRSHAQGADVTVEEYARDGWTFHGKGIWCYLDQELPQLTMIGSPNYGYRSIYRDLEAQVTLIPGSDALRAAIHREAQDLRAYAHPVDIAELRKRTRAAPLWLHGLRPLIQNKM